MMMSLLDAIYAYTMNTSVMSTCLGSRPGLDVKAVQGRMTAFCLRLVCFRFAQTGLASRQTQCMVVLIY